MQMRKPIGFTILAFVCGLSACSSDEDRQAKPAQATPTEVGYVTLEAQSVPLTVDLHGRVIASAIAEVRPQVDGIVRDVLFAEGRNVEQGDALYKIDDRKFQAAYASAEAALKKAQATTNSAQSTYDRNERLAKTEAVSTQTVDDAEAALLQAKADEAAAQADLETAQIDLDNTTIHAPISGVIGVSEVSVGALVTAEQTDALATIRTVDHVYVDLADSSANFLRIRDKVQAGELEHRSDGPPPISLTLEDGNTYSSSGEMSFADMVVSQTTGTFTLRVNFANPDGVLIPGMFVTATVELGVIPDAFLVPQRAVSRDDSGKATVYVISGDGKAERRNVTTSGSLNNDWIVVDGVAEGDRLIVDGFQKFSDGAEVSGVAVTINADGVVEQSIADDAGEETP
ncbi:UNVERIFIED_ORG: membrane fusion protein (multidrug efflux system) [Martelella mediterranea]